MQYNAGGHAAKDTLAFLNPIETLWNRIKDMIEEQDPEIHRSYLKLRAAIIEDWSLISDEEVRDLIRTMHDRCQAVIDADGWHTKY